MGLTMAKPIYRPWFDAATDSPLLTEYARKLDSFNGVLADRKVELAELEDPREASSRSYERGGTSAGTRRLRKGYRITL